MKKQIDQQFPNNTSFPSNELDENSAEFNELLDNPEFKTLLQTLGRPVSLKPGEKQISDLTIDSFGSPLICANLSPNGIVILATTKNNDSILYVINIIQEGAPPLIMHQRFSLSQDTVIYSIPIQNPKSLGIIYAAAGEIRSSYVEFDESSNPVVTKDSLSIQKAYTSSVQKIAAYRDGSIFFVLSDCSTVMGYKHDGENIFRINLGRVSDICLSSDYSKLFIASNQQVYSYSIKTDPKISLDLITKLDAGENIYSICFLSLTNQLIIGGQSTLIVFHEDLKRNQIVKRISSPKGTKPKPLKAVAPHPTVPFVAALFGPCGLRVYDIGSGKVYSELTETHRGDASSVIWSFDGKLLFVSSKDKPNIELFMFNQNK